MKRNGYKIDIWILIPVLLLLIFSIGVVYSASSDYSFAHYKDASQMFKLHLVKVFLGIFLIFFFAKIDYRYYQDISKILLFASIFALVSVFIIGVSIRNVNRWINIGPISFQPSDLAKYTLIIHLATLLVRKKGYVHELYRGYLPMLFYILVVCVLVAKQPNFSTAVIIMGSSMLLLLTSEVKFKHIVFTCISLLPIAIGFILTKSYIMNRFEHYADFTSGGNAQHQLNQAIIGLGSGGFFGVGIGNSIQKEFFLPDAHGDFIFSVIGEEYGFIGAVSVVVLFALITVRGYRVSKMIQDDFGKFIAFGITTIISAYAVVNISVACGIIPTTGVPVPFISYGGTALIFNSIAIGILLNISSYRNEAAELVSADNENT